MPLRTYCEAAYKSRASYGCLQHRYVVCQVSLKHTVPNLLNQSKSWNHAYNLVTIHSSQLCIAVMKRVETGDESGKAPVEVLRAAKRRQAVCVRKLCKHTNFVAVLKLAAAGHQTGR